MRRQSETKGKMPTVAATQENDHVYPLERGREADEVDAAIAWHDGDVRATVATLLADCAYLRWQLELAGRAWAEDLFADGSPTRRAAQRKATDSWRDAMEEKLPLGAHCARSSEGRLVSIL